MKLIELRIFHNRYDFESDGVAPHGYGAVGSFDLPVGTFNVRYSPEVVAEIMRVLAPITADAFQSVASVTESDVRRSTDGYLLAAPAPPPSVPDELSF